MLTLHSFFPYSTSLQSALFILQAMVVNIPSTDQDFRSRAVPIVNALKCLVKEQGGERDPSNYKLQNLAIAREQLVDFKNHLPMDLPFLSEKIDKIVHKIQVLNTAIQIVGMRRIDVARLSDDGLDSDLDKVLFDEFDNDSDEDQRSMLSNDSEVMELDYE